MKLTDSIKVVYRFIYTKHLCSILIIIMFSRFICINYMKNGKCTDSSCKLQHVKDIKILNNDDEEVKQEKPAMKAKKPTTAAS